MCGAALIEHTRRRTTVTTTNDRLKDSAAESAGSLIVDAGIPIGDGHMGAQGSVDEQKDDTRQNDILVAERTAIVRDTARRIDIESERTSGTPSYDVCEIDFRGHHYTCATRRWGPYEIYRVVYHYGYDLGADARYCTADWATVEQDARPRWEERNPGTWEEFKDTIRYAWAKVRISGDRPHADTTNSCELTAEKYGN
jgi:hypothetical protein